MQMNNLSQIRPALILLCFTLLGVRANAQLKAPVQVDTLKITSVIYNFEKIRRENWPCTEIIKSTTEFVFGDQRVGIRSASPGYEEMYEGKEIMYDVDGSGYIHYYDNSSQRVVVYSGYEFICGGKVAEPEYMVMHAITDLPRRDEMRIPPITSPQEGVACFQLSIWRDGKVTSATFVESQSSITDENVIKELKSEAMLQRYASHYLPNMASRTGFVYYIIGNSVSIQNATFDGGNPNHFAHWVNAHVKYPSSAKKKYEQGVVHTCFTVFADGTVGNITVVKGVSQSLNDEAVKVISKSPKWTPAAIDGKPISMSFLFPVEFWLL